MTDNVTIKQTTTKALVVNRTQEVITVKTGIQGKQGNPSTVPGPEGPPGTPGPKGDKGDPGTGGGGGAGGGGFTSVNPSTIKLDAITDDSTALQNELDRISGLGGGTLKLISTAGMYITTLIYMPSEVTLDLSECYRVYLGALGGIKFGGSVEQLPLGTRPHLFANINSGDTVFSIVVFGANITPAAGQNFNVRGAHTATNHVLSDFSGTIVSAVNNGAVTGGVKWTITSDVAFDEDFLVDNTGSDYALTHGGHDYSTFAIDDFSAATGNIAPGSMTVDVADGTKFSVGVWVMVSDSEQAGSSLGVVDNNPIHREINQIVKIVSNKLYLQRAVTNSFTTAYDAGVTVLNPIINAHLIGASFTYVVDLDASRHVIHLTRSIDCSVQYCRLIPVYNAGSWYGHNRMALRVEMSTNCNILYNTIEGKGSAEDYTGGGGKGYGLTLVACNHNKFIGNTTKNCRHGVLIQGGACGNEIALHLDEGARISAIDLHGANSINNHIHSFFLTAGPLCTGDSTNRVGIRIGNSSHRYGDHNNLIENGMVMNFSQFPIRPSDSSAVTGTGISLLAKSGNNTFKNIEVHNCDNGIVAQYTTGYADATTQPNRFKDILLRKCITQCVKVDGGDGTGTLGSTLKGGSVFSEIVLDGVVSDGNPRHFELSYIGTLYMTNCQIRASVPSSGIYSANLKGIPHVIAANNLFNGANRGFKINTCPNAIIQKNMMLNQVESSVFSDDGDSNSGGFVFIDNTYTGTATPTKTSTSSSGTVLDQVTTLKLSTQSKTNDYTAVITDADSMMTYMNKGTANNYTVPPNSSVAFAVGSVLRLTQVGAGQTTVVAGSGVTVSTANAGLKLRAQYSEAKLTKQATDTWILSGDTTS